VVGRDDLTLFLNHSLFGACRLQGGWKEGAHNGRSRVGASESAGRRMAREEEGEGIERMKEGRKEAEMD